MRTLYRIPMSENRISFKILLVVTFEALRGELSIYILQHLRHYQFTRALCDKQIRICCSLLEHSIISALSSFEFEYIYIRCLESLSS